MGVKDIRHSITIVIPTYNLNTMDKIGFFRGLLESIVSASKMSSVFWINQLVIVDDSPSSSQRRQLLDEVDKTSGLFDVKFVENENNVGQAMSRNNGALLAKSSFLHFIDQDDQLSADFYIEIGKRYNDDVDFYISDCVMLNKPELSFYKNHTKRWIDGSSSFNDIKLLLVNNILNSPGQMLVRTNLFREIGGFPDLGSRGSDDFAFYLRALDFNHKYIFVDKAKFHYRIHDGQSSKILNMWDSEKEAFDSVETSYELFHRFLKSIKVSWVFYPLRLMFYKAFFNALK